MAVQRQNPAYRPARPTSGHSPFASAVRPPEGFRAPGGKPGLSRREMTGLHAIFNRTVASLRRLALATWDFAVISAIRRVSAGPSPTQDNANPSFLAKKRLISRPAPPPNRRAQKRGAPHDAPLACRLSRVSRSPQTRRSRRHRRSRRDPSRRRLPREWRRPRQSRQPEAWCSP